MGSILSFLRREAGPPSEEQPAGPAAAHAAGAEASIAGGGQPLTAAAAMAPGSGSGLTPPINLQPYVEESLTLISQAAGVPRDHLSLVELSHRALGVGGRRGMQRRGGIDIAELRGGWLDAVLRFDLLGPDLDSVNQQATALQAALLTKSQDLRRVGVLQLTPSGSADGELGTSPSSWRKTLDYRVLYEYRYEDADGAASLIARIPVDGETDAGPSSHETMEIRDWMVRWDDEAAPPLEVAAPPNHTVSIRGLSIAAHLPAGGPAGQVKQTIVHSGQTDETQFNSLALFRDRFQLDSSLLRLVFPPSPPAAGETQELRDYQVGSLQFDPPIVLKGGGDLFRISFSASSFPASSQSVVYLRALIT